MSTSRTISLYAIADHAVPGDIVFFDIDDTVLIPGIKKYRDMPKAMKEAVDAIRLLEEKGVNVVFLTARHGEKEVIFDWTFKHLGALGLKPKVPPRLNFDNLTIAFENPNHRYQEGVIFASSMDEEAHKGTVLKQFLKQLPKSPRRIWVMDDQEAQLQSIAAQDFQGLVDNAPPRLFQFLPYRAIYQGINSGPQTAQDRAMEPETEGSASQPPMPEDLNRMEVEEHLDGGSGGVFILKDMQTGKKYTLKTASSEEQLSDEILSDRLYQLAGIPVPSFSVFDSIPGRLAAAMETSPKGLFRLAEFIEADEVLNSEEQRTTNPVILAQFADGFIMDALLGNVDIAAHLDNTIVEKNSQELFRIDNGCGLRQQARGEFKATSSIVEEIDILRSAQSNLGQILYQTVDEPFIQHKVKALLERFPKIIDELYEMNRVLNLKGGTELIQLITDRLIYLRHRFCPDFKLNIPHHPADDYTSASTFIVSKNEAGEPCVLLGKRIREEWYGNLGGKSEKEDGDLSTTAARETLEESADLIPLPDQGLKGYPYHDLLTYDSKKEPILHRMYMVSYNKEISFDRLQQAATGRAEGVSRHAIEYTDFKQVPLKAIREALNSGPQGREEGQPVYLVKLADGTTISLHPPLASMLKQREAKKHLDALAEEQLYQPDKESQGAMTLDTPKKRARDIVTQGLKKSELLFEFKQTKAEPLKERLKEHTTQKPKELPNEGPSGLHQPQAAYRSQTELYLQSVLGEEFDPDPEGLEKNVNYFLDCFSEFKRKAYFKSPENRRQMIEIILKEREAVARGEVVLYHAAETSINFIIDFFTQLRRVLFAEAREGYRAFRATDNFTQAFEHIGELIEHFSERGTKDIDNYQSFFQEIALSCNLFLFGNDGVKFCSSLAIFFENKSVNPPDTRALLTNIMTTLGMGEAETYAILQLYEAYERDTPRGNLYQICVKNKAIDQMSYPAGYLGRHNPLGKEEHLSQILSALGAAPIEHKDYIQDLQVRLLIQPKMHDKLHVNEFQNINSDEPSASKTRHLDEIKQLSRQLAEKILIKNQMQDAFAQRSGISEQVQSVKANLGIPGETTNPALRLAVAIYTKQISLAAKLIKQYPSLDLARLPNPDLRVAIKTISIINLIGISLGEEIYNILEQLNLTGQPLEAIINEPNVAKDKGFTPLWLASGRGNLDTVRFLIEHGASIDKGRDEDKGMYDDFTPLWIAAYKGQMDVVRFLIDRGASIDKAKDYGSTALYVAAQNGHLDVVRFLIDRGASIDKAKDDGSTPLWIAAYNGHLDVVRFLIDRGSSIDKAKDDGSTPLWIAAYNGDLAIVEFLIQSHADVNAARKDGSTALYVAAQNGHLDVVRFLIDRGASIDKPMDDGITPLYVAAQNGHLDIVEFLIDQGANVNVATDNGCTPLYMAAQNGHLGVVELLIDHGASIDKAMDDGSTPLFVAAQNGRLDIVKLLIERWASIDKAKDDGSTPLWIAAYNGDLAIVEFLIQKGADVNVAMEGGVTPLYVAAQNGRLDIVKLLIEHGASIDKARDDGSTPLWIAAYRGHLDIVEFLIQKGADVDVVADDGVTARSIAAQLGYMNIAELFEENLSKKIDSCPPPTSSGFFSGARSSVSGARSSERIIDPVVKSRDIGKL